MPVSGMAVHRSLFYGGCFLVWHQGVVSSLDLPSVDGYLCVGSRFHIYGVDVAPVRPQFHSERCP
jgi:hypothetical protein